MRNVIMVGCDLHDNSLLLRIAEATGKAVTVSVRNNEPGRKRMIADLKRRAKAASGARIVFAYEASSQGFGLYDQLTAAGMECYVLAPTKLPRSQRQRKEKTDEKDAQQLLEVLRGHVLAGNALPSIWVPDRQTRDDRELVRMRLDVGAKRTATKTQIQCLLKRNGVRRPKATGTGWTLRFRAWLNWLANELGDRGKRSIAVGAQGALASLLRQLLHLQGEEERLDYSLHQLAESARYAAPMQAMLTLRGVGELTALVFLAEMGDLTRFANRRQIASYLGLAPSSYESGEANNRKGHITHAGSHRVRKVLCQAVWAQIRHNSDEKEAYERIKAKNPRKAKIAVVAGMRRLAVRLFHRGHDAIAAASNRPSSA